MDFIFKGLEEAVLADWLAGLGPPDDSFIRTLMALHHFIMRRSAEDRGVAGFMNPKFKLFSHNNSQSSKQS